MRLVTIGGYGFTDSTYLDALRGESVNILADVRLRRGLRGRRYAFLNSTRLQRALADNGIGYAHIRSLAPTQSIRDIQRRFDAAAGAKKRSRRGLCPDFVEAYRREVLDRFDVADFHRAVGGDGMVVALFCVEEAPEACHRSLAAEWLSQAIGATVTHLRP